MPREQRAPDPPSDSSTPRKEALIRNRRRYGLIAGNGQFPFLVLEAARSLGVEVVVVAIKEEAFPRIADLGYKTHWISLGQLGKLIELLKREGVDQALMAGQVQHKQIFSSIVPDRRLFKLLMSLGSRNTDSLIGGVADVLEQEGIRLIDSTAFLKPLIPGAGVLTRRSPSDSEIKDIHYGRAIAKEMARMDIGQSVVVRNQGLCRRGSHGRYRRCHSPGRRPYRQSAGHGHQGQQAPAGHALRRSGRRSTHPSVDGRGSCVGIGH